ncbi:uroporphyrinogen-III C-methyltransferase [Thaumasiovibrio sp. DFM-14]|uniref:uroporphyrinogen-III C-methyltransferase n=1 Tax=Thaumasiovibrio sp. DFM-14 TaxID=3384792 RepID=UPI0039A385D7
MEFQPLLSTVQRFVGKPTISDVSAKEEIRQFVQQLIKSIPFRSQAKGSVALIGAGPGDPGLLTIRAVQLMQEAQIVLYDYLVSDQILALFPLRATMICVGKRAGYHSVPQEETNRLLVKYAQQGKRVVRIKGGDSFIFGRGGEELEVLSDKGIEFQVVPGITAAAGATAYAGIPLTHRDHAQSAMFITGHLKAERDDLEWATLARGNQTLVIYMGLIKSSYIQSQLIAYGRNPDTPVAIIENGTLAQQKVLIGELAELASLAENAQSPALIVVGEVVRLADKLAWFGQSQTTHESTATMAGE